MTGFRKELTDLIRPNLKSGKLSKELVDAIDGLLDRAGVPRDAPVPAPAPPPAPAPAPPAPAVLDALPPPPGKLDVAALLGWLGLPAAGGFDAAATTALFDRLSSTRAPALTDADFAGVAAELGVSPGIVRAVNKVEAPRGAFDTQGRPSILYEKHVFARNTGGRFNASHPILSAAKWQPGTYGALSIQYDKLAQACALDPDAAFRACSWVSEAAHLDCFVRFIRSNNLVAKLQACTPGDPASCVPFVRAYNGPAFAKNNYHVKLAAAAL
jgi:N-acetylmuramidase-like protein